MEKRHVTLSSRQTKALEDKRKELDVTFSEMCRRALDFWVDYNRLLTIQELEEPDRQSVK